MPENAYAFLVERNDQLAKALGKNKDVAQFVQALLEHLIDYAEARGLPPDDLLIDPPQIMTIGEHYLISARIRKA